MLQRRALVAAGVAAAIPGLAAAQDASQVERGAKLGRLSPFEAEDLEGHRMWVPARGKPAVVNFWATWCPPCRTEMPLLHQLAEFYGDRFVLQLVNFKEHPDTIRRHARAASWAGQPVLRDPAGEAAAAWGVRHFPTTFGFDAGGTVRWRVRGEYDWSSAEAGRLVESLWA